MSGDHNMHQADHIPETTKMIECATCGYPLAESERAGLVEINGKMHRPWVDLSVDDFNKLEKRYGDATGLVLLDIIADTSRMLKENNT